MRKIIVSFVWVCLLFINLKAQQLNIPNGKLIPAPKVNGTLDDLTDFAQRVQVPFMMPDSTILYTDIYLPILQDSLTFDVLPAQQAYFQEIFFPRHLIDPAHEFRR